MQKKDQNLEIPKRKRGRPRKNPLPEVTQIIPIPKRRGRPKKAVQAPPAKTAKRGRKKKKTVVPKAPRKKETAPHLPKQVSDTCINAKLFVSYKSVSKQLPWVAEWLRKFHESVSHKHNEQLLPLIDELNSGINRLLKDNGDELSLHIPKCMLVSDGTVLKVIFDPITKGADCQIYYKPRIVPQGLSPSMKANAVANLFTGIIKSYVPVGACG